jgi:hypothetical protein
MKLGRVWPILAVSLLALPATVAAQARGGTGSASRAPAVHSGPGTGFMGRGANFDGRFRDGRFRRNTIIYASPYYYADPTPVSYAPPPVYIPPVVVVTTPASAYGAPSSAYAPAPPPPPAPSEPPAPAAPRSVEFSTGRYELRGDGVNAPYIWVWIPNPPTAPPGPPAPPPALYRWTDERGVTTWTDDANKVPQKFRAQAMQSQP